jgi:cystathionine beta-lyase
MRRETKLMHYGRTTLPGPANPPVIRASTILHETVESYRETRRKREDDDSVLSYGRRGTTPAHALMAAIADMEGGDGAWLFPTGVAAIASTLSAFLKPGDHLLMVDTVFPATRSFCDTVLVQNGIQIDYFPWDATDLSAWMKPETRVIFAESPGSQTLEVMDLPALTRWARDHDVTVIADNTYGSGWLYRSLVLGCDVSIIAGTKYLGGHADVMMGAATAKGDAAAILRKVVHVTGQTLAPDEAYATLRGMRTLNLRLERHETNALELARWFAARPEVMQVLHPALPGHPGGEIWARDASGTNGLFSVVFTPGFEVERVLNGLQLFAIGSSWGGFESLAMPADPYVARQIKPEAVQGSMVRFHAGLEHVSDLIADLEQAFAQIEALGR